MLEDYGVLEQTYVWDDSNPWQDICFRTPCGPTGVSSANDRDIAAMYGKAVADLRWDHPDGSFECTGWLVDNDILVTAHHCTAEGSKTNVIEEYLPITATFGKYGSAFPASFLGDEDARDRLRRWVGSVSSANATVQELTQFTCTFDETSYRISEGERDIHYYRCAPHFRDGIAFYPGDLYGHFNVQNMCASGSSGCEQGNSNTYADDTEFFNLSANVRNNDDVGSVDHVLIDRGKIYDGDDSCNLDYDNCFEATRDDMVCGSSGGVAWHPSTRKAFGVWSGIAQSPFCDPPGPNNESCNRDVQGSGNGWCVSNRYSYTTDMVNSRYANTTPTHNLTNLDGLSPTWTGWRGGTGGTLHTGNCPMYPVPHMAAGVIGTTSSSLMTGNFGIICVPYRTSTMYRELDRAKVYVGGSIGTGFVEGLYDLNTYYNEVLADEGQSGAISAQNVHMCRPGWALIGVRARATATRITEIDGIKCRWLDTGSIQTITWSDEIGLGLTGTSAWTECSTSEVVTRLDIRSGWETDGFRLYCDND